MKAVLILLQLIENAANILKREIENVNGVSIHPLNPIDISENKIIKIFPDLLKKTH